MKTFLTLVLFVMALIFFTTSAVANTATIPGVVLANTINWSVLGDNDSTLINKFSTNTYIPVSVGTIKALDRKHRWKSAQEVVRALRKDTPNIAAFVVTAGGDRAGGFNRYRNDHEIVVFVTGENPRGVWILAYFDPANQFFSFQSFFERVLEMAQLVGPGAKFVM